MFAISLLFGLLVGVLGAALLTWWQTSPALQDLRLTWALECWMKGAMYRAGGRARRALLWEFIGNWLSPWASAVESAEQVEAELNEFEAWVSSLEA